MARNRPLRCKACRGWAHEVGLISFRGLCEACASERQLENNRAIADKSGPAYEAWLVASAQAAIERAMRALDGTAALDRQGHSDGSAAAPQP